MKIIPKFQKGGGFSSFFTVYTPTQAPRQTSEERSTRRSRREEDDEDDQKGKLTEKQLFDMISKIDGLPNEMISIIRNLQNTFAMDNLVGTDPTNLATTYLSSLYQLKIAEGNKKKYDEALSAASKSGALNEPAISTDGKLIVQTQDGQLDTVSLDEYFNDAESYQPLTVSNLARLRAYDPSLNNNQSVFDILNNSIGFEEFQALVDSARKGLGTNEFTRNGLFTNEEEASKGLQLLNTLRNDDKAMAVGSAGIEGLYEYKVIDKTQAQQLKALTQYITAVLPDRAKTWAALKTGNPNKNKATQDLVFTYLFSGSTQSHQFDIQYKGSIDEVTGNKESKDKETKGDNKETYLTTIQNGLAGRSEQRSLLPGNQGKFSVTGQVYGSFMDQDGNTLSNVTLLDLLTKTGLAGISNTKSISFGDNLVSSNVLSKIAVENNGGFRAVLPSVRKGSSVVPNFELIEQFDSLVQEVNDQLGNNASYEERQALLEKKLDSTPELKELLNATGKLDPSKFSVFFIVDGLASDINFDFKSRDEKGQWVSLSDSTNPYIRETDDEEDKKYFVDVTKTEDFDQGNIFNPFDWFGNYSHVYKGSIFIPIQTNNRLAAIIFSGQKVKEDTALKIEAEYQRSNSVNTSMYNSNLLFQ